MTGTQLQHLLLPRSKVKIFYRESGKETDPVILLLHGFPSSSHQYRNLIPILATKYRVLAPDLPGFGFSFTPEDFTYTFDNLANVVSEFLDELSIKKFSMYIFGYGAPTGLRVALERPDAVQAIITQSGNAYEEGHGSFWDSIRELWKSNNRETVREELAEDMFSLETTKHQYSRGTQKGRVIAPEAYHLDYALLQRPFQRRIQLDLFWDYRNNLTLYPKFQEYFRQSQVPLLAAWGINDKIFIPAGAEAFKRDLPEAEVHLLDGGHFAAETETEEIGGLILEFLAKCGI
ncbi:Alpha/Beta hydrolase protein [Aspergillus unguis]